MLNDQKSDAKKFPVVLVHGFWNTHSYLAYMANQLRKNGWKVLNTLDLVPNDGKERLEVLAAQLNQYIKLNVEEGAPFHIVAYSMGGLVSRYYFQFIADKSKVKSLVTIASPNHGTIRAAMFDRIGCYQMLPGSNFLNRLNADTSCLEKTNYTSIWTRFDTIILPNDSAKLNAGKEVKLNFGVHALLPFTPKVLKEVEDALLLGI